MTSDAEDKINAAIKILVEKDAGKYICYFLNTYDFGDSNIIVDNLKYTDVNYQEEEIIKTLVINFNINQIEKQVNIKKDESIISIIACNRSSGIMPDGDSYDFSKLLVFRNYECVLEESIDLDCDQYGDFWCKKYFFDFTLKKFKNTPWMDEIKECSIAIEDHKNKRDQKKRIDKLNEVSKNIEL